MFRCMICARFAVKNYAKIFLRCIWLKLRVSEWLEKILDEKKDQTSSYDQFCRKKKYSNFHWWPLELMNKIFDTVKMPEISTIVLDLNEELMNKIFCHCKNAWNFNILDLKDFGLKQLWLNKFMLLIYIIHIKLFNIWIFLGGFQL